MIKKRMLISALIVVALAICGALLLPLPTQVFAAETQVQQDEIDLAEAGTFEGQGYYVVGEEATLKATMNPGYAFDKWVAIDDSGVEIELPTTDWSSPSDLEYTFEIRQNMTIKPTCHKIKYLVNFDDVLYDGLTELKDFNSTITNKTQQEGDNYYNDEIEIVVNVKDDVYIYDLLLQNISINDIDLYTIIYNNNPMEVQCDITNNSLTGFSKFLIKFNIQQDITISIDYNYIHKLKVVSSNSIPISEIMPFITITDYYSQPNLNEYIYLVPKGKFVNIIIGAGNDVYSFETHQFPMEDPKDSSSLSKKIDSDTTFTLTYNKKDYELTFKSYLINEYGNYDEMLSPLYNIENVILKAGDSATICYDATTKQITILDVTDNSESVYTASAVYGYQFLRFEYTLLDGSNQNLGLSNTYTMDAQNPNNIEIKLIFEYIAYNFEVKLVDSFFAEGSYYDINGTTYSFSNANEPIKVIKGQQITLQAISNNYIINGWSWSATPETDGYISGEQTNTYSFNFEPASDNNSVNYTIYVDIDYQYTSITYALRANSIFKNVDYNQVSVDLTNKKVTFVDTEGNLTSKEITYTDSDVTTQNTATIINAGEFGNIEIEGNVLSYTFEGIKASSIDKETKDGVDIYTFNKYTYFGDLKIGVVSDIAISLSADKSVANIVINGEIYTHEGKTVGELQNLSANVVAGSNANEYIIEYTYPIYLYMATESLQAGDYLLLNNVRYDYDGEKFEVKKATINTPKTITYTSTKSATYNIQLSNLLPNSLLLYQTKTTNPTNYQFVSFVHGSGRPGSFVYNDYNCCLWSAGQMPELNVEYKQLTNNIFLLINNESAYSYEKVTISIVSSGNSSTTNGNIIAALDADSVTIIINQTDIVKGYQFQSYQFDGNDITDIDNPLTLSFTMDSRVYAGQTIYINFIPITYTVNINYIDNDENVVQPQDANGGLILQGQTSSLTTIDVTLIDRYVLEAVPANGYYTKLAYIVKLDNEKLNLDDLITNGSWTLNSENFLMSIIENANQNNEIELYIGFTIYTYSIKVYFDIETKADSITYPDLYINNIKQVLTVDIEDGATKRFVFSSGYAYGSDVELNLTQFMLGTTIDKWLDALYQQLTTANQYTLTNITNNIVLIVKLKYVEYDLKFVKLDGEGQECNYGSASTDSASFQLFDKITYSVTAYDGYVLKEKYYYNKLDEKQNEDNTSDFYFNPSNFKIEDGNTFKIYLVFTLKTVTLKISNMVDGGMYYFEGQTASKLATYTVTRKRGNVVDSLDIYTGYHIQTGDILTMTITPISMGIELPFVKLGDTLISESSTTPFMLKKTNDYSSDLTLIAMHYELQIEFTSGLISVLADETQLINVLKIKTYNVEYTYNYIDYRFGITLTRKYDDTTSYSEKDKSMLAENVGFGTEMIFGYEYEGMNTGAGNKFKVNGFMVDGVKQDYTEKFEFNDIFLWEQIALNKYKSGLNDIEVVLLLTPKITLYNAEYDAKTGYLYQRTYLGQNQGLVSGTENPDIVVGGDFEVQVQYSYDGGVNYSDIMPIDVGKYPVKIVALISSATTQDAEVEFEERVTYQITPALLTISLKTYNSSNPTTKVYDGTNNLSPQVLTPDIKLNGVFERDENKIFINQNILRIQLSGISVNSITSLYDINVFNIQLIDDSNNGVKNYKLASGENVVFVKVGKVNPKPLTITGFAVTNKVYDGTRAINVNVDEINYIGKLESDSTQILTDNLKFYLEDFTIGKERKVLLDWSEALVGADSINYSITYTETTIDIYPYELTYNVNGYGTVKIVDVDKKCLIPIDGRMIAYAYEKGSNQYNSVYSTIENNISQGEKLKVCYEIIMQVGAVNQNIPEGLYIYLPMVKRVSQVEQVTDAENAHNLTYIVASDNYIVVKAKYGDALFGLVAKTVYLPLWLIILIIILALLLIAIIVIIVIAIRRKMKDKYSKYDKI